MTRAQVGSAVRHAIHDATQGRGLTENDVHEEASVFLDLAVDSLELVEIIATLEDCLGIELPVQRWLDDHGSAEHDRFLVGSLIDLCVQACATA